MTKKETARRYCVFFAGLMFVSFGIAFVTKASLGTSPISALPYTLSLIIPRLTLGNWTILFSFLFMILQVILLGRETKKIEIVIQIAITFVFGYFIDFSLFLIKAFSPQMYVVKMVSLIIGCCIIAFGAYLETVADVAMIPADAFIRALVKVTKKEYGMVRMISDVTMTLSAAALCLIFLGELTGVREGSIIAAVLIGNIMRMYSKKLGRFADFLVLSRKAAAAQEQPEESGFRQGRVPAVVTIAREYGSGGRVIGRLVADSLGMKFYDSELIQMTAAESGYTEESVSEKEQKISNALLHDLYSQYTAALNEADLPQIERLFNAEKKVIRQIASEGPCVIVGRLSNRILRDHPNALHIFISAAPDAKVRRVVKRDGLSEAQAAEKIKKVERERANYCKYFSKTSWNSVDNYDMTFRSDRYGIEETADMITEIVRRYSFG